MKKIKNKKSFSLFEVIIIVLITFVLSGVTTGFIIFKGNNTVSVDLSNNKGIKEFLEVYASLITNYYEDVNENELINSAINGMFEYLGDDYTTYLNKQSSEELDEVLSGEYEGIGVQIDEGNIVVNVFDNSPAQEADIRVNDVIIKVNGTDVTKMDTTPVANLIKGSKDGKPVITLLRDKKEFNVTVTLKKIDMPTVQTEIFEESNKKIAYLYIDSFSKNTDKQVSEALKEFAKDKVSNLIVDVRGNSGGYLNVAEKIASLFIEKGKVIYSLEDKTSVKTVKDKTTDKYNGKIVVLINKGSASASEILAASLKESYGATIVGETSYGKGKVQQTMSLDTGGKVKYTSSRWLTPKGICIDGVGIKPDHEINPNYDLKPKSNDVEVFSEEYKVFQEHLREIQNQQLAKAKTLF